MYSLVTGIHSTHNILLVVHKGCSCFPANHWDSHSHQVQCTYPQQSYSCSNTQLEREGGELQVSELAEKLCNIQLLVWNYCFHNNIPDYKHIVCMWATGISTIIDMHARMCYSITTFIPHHCLHVHNKYYNSTVPYNSRLRQSTPVHPSRHILEPVSELHV